MSVYYPTIAQESATITHEGREFTVQGQWDRGARGTRDEPPEPAGFIDPTIIDETGKDVTNELDAKESRFLILAAEAVIQYGN